MYILNGHNMTTREDAWNEIKTVLEAPEWFGNNLDALNDLLGEKQGEIRLTHACAMLNSLGAYGCRMLSVFYDAAADGYISFRAGGHE